jgi:zinc transport system substrate-binding protein
MPGRGAWYAAVAAAVAAGLVGCSTAEDPWQGQPGPPRVVVSFPPLACFVKNVGGTHVGVLSVCKEQGPHGHPYNVREAAALREANLLLANGLGLDDRFMDKLKDDGNPRLAYLKLGAELDPKLLLRLDGGEPDKKGGRVEYDPHAWLGVKQSCAMVERIGDELAKADAAHADEYKKNAADYVKRLKGLHDEYKKRFADKSNVNLVSFHDSLQYVAKDYGLTIVDVIELDPGEDPNAKRMADLLEHWTGADVKPEKRPAAITVEPQYTGKAVETLLADLKARKIEDVKKVVFDPLETATEKECLEPGWYEQKLKADLDELLKALPDKK